MKPFYMSKTWWFGFLTSILSGLVIVADTIQLLTPEQQAAIDGLFGPGTTAVIGAVVVLLRQVTRTSINMRPGK